MVDMSQFDTANIMVMQGPSNPVSPHTMSEMQDRTRGNFAWKRTKPTLESEVELNMEVEGSETKVLPNLSFN